MSDQSELYYAEMEAARNEAEKTYFDARPTLDTKIHHLIFRVGFVRGFNLLWDKQQSAADRMSEQKIMCEMENVDESHDLSGGVVCIACWNRAVDPAQRTPQASRRDRGSVT